MLNAEVHIRSIDYERTFDALFPMLMETVNRMDGDNMLVRLLQKLGETSKDVVTGILQKLSHQHRDEILCRIVSYYRADICRQMNALLAANGFEDCVAVQWLGAQAHDSEIWLTLNHVEVNYASLLKNEQVQKAIGNAAEDSPVGQFFQLFSGNHGGLMSKMVSDKVNILSQKKGTGVMMNLLRGDIEKQALHFLEKKYLPQELGRMMSGFLEEKGIYAEVAAVEIQRSKEALPEEVAESFLGKELEYAMVDAVAEYLRER